MLRSALSDATILAGLNAAASMHEAAKSLGVSRQALHRRCMPDAALREAYRACGLRGHKSTTRSVVKHCALCFERDHNRQNCPKRVRNPKRCRQCEGLPWRRPMNKRRLCKCGEAYAPEPSITLDSVFLMANHNRREVI